MDSRSGWFCLGGPVFDAARPAPSPSAPGQRPTGGDFFLTKAYDHVGVCRDAAQYPRRHGSRPVLCACRTGRRAGDVGGCNGIGPRNGLQNFPEGAAISLPLRQEGLSATRSFAYGALSGIVEPIGGLLAVLIAGSVTPLMPWFLSFAAGAMIYVVVEELIPEAHLGEHSHPGTAGVMLGFLVMMILDVALG